MRRGRPGRSNSRLSKTRTQAVFAQKHSCQNLMLTNMPATLGVGDFSGAASSFSQVLSKNTVLPERYFFFRAEPIISTAKIN